jgi:hypothetical protein
VADGFRRLMGIALLALFSCLVLLVARGAVEGVERQAAAEPWKAGLTGLAAQILAIPLLIVTVVVLAISIIGIPLLLLVPFAILGLVLGAFLGYAGVALGVGQWMERRFGWRLGSPFVVLLAGVAAIQVWTLIGHLVPVPFFAGLLVFIGVLIQYAVWTVGFGAVLLSRFGNRPPAAAAPAPVSPTPGEGMIAGPESFDTSSRDVPEWHGDAGEPPRPGD